MSEVTISQRHDQFKNLHQQGCFMLPNPWDIGSAKLFESLGFKALATTSSGFAFSQGKADGGVSANTVIEHCNALVKNTQLPINVDFENGYADDLEQFASNVRQCAQTGVSGISIEDAANHHIDTLYDISQATKRIQVARQAIDSVDAHILLIGRAECFILGHPDLEETIARLKAYAQAGADVLYAPGLSKSSDIQAVVDAVAPKPINVLMGPASDLSFQQLKDLGVRRISTGGALALMGWSAVAQAAKAVQQGQMDAARPSLGHDALGQIFS